MRRHNSAGMPPALDSMGQIRLMLPWMTVGINRI